MQVNGFAAQFEKTGDKDALTAVKHFFDIVTKDHSYPSGGQLLVSAHNKLCLPVLYLSRFGMPFTK